MDSIAVIGPELADIVTEGAAMVDRAEAAVLQCRTAPICGYPGTSCAAEGLADIRDRHRRSLPSWRWWH